MFLKMELMKFKAPGDCPKCKADTYIEEVVYTVDANGSGTKNNKRVCSKCSHSFNTQGGTNQGVIDLLKRDGIGHTNMVGQYIVKKADVPK